MTDCYDKDCGGMLIWRRDLDENEFQRVAQCKKCKRLVLFFLEKNKEDKE